MLSNLKPLVVVLFMALVTFRIVRPFCERFMTPESFVLRRNAWLALTIVAFLSPEFWMFALFEFALLIWMQRREENLLALYVLVTFTVPNVRFYLPTVLVNQLFDLTQYRILSLAILIPIVSRIAKRPDQWLPARLGLVDVLMLGFVLIQLVVPMPYESGTNTLRRGVLLLLDTYLVVYTFQRLATKERIVDTLACFWLSVTLMVPVAIFETGKGWLLYIGLSEAWGDTNIFSYLMRGNSLRAQVAAGHSINLGYLLAAGMGAFLFLWRPGVSRRFGWLVIGAFCVALFATGSRGAWVTSMIVAAVFVGFRPNAGRRLASTAFTGAVVLGLLYLSPLKESVIDRLPIIGNADQDTIDYRRQLLEVSWQLIQQNPFFGDPFVASRMESLRQGQGIIDIVNGYVFVALFNGLIALFFVVAGFALGLGRTFIAWRAARSDEEMATLGVTLAAMFIGTLFFIATAGITPSHYMLLGLLCSYWRVGMRSAQGAPSTQGRGPAPKIRQTSYLRSP